MVVISSNQAYTGSAEDADLFLFSTATASATSLNH